MPRSLFPASGKAVLLNYASAASLLLSSYAFYTTNGFYRAFLAPLTYDLLTVALVAYLALLPLYYATFPDDYTVKCRLFWRAVGQLGRRRPLPEERVALRAVLVKAIYLPLMLNWLLFHMHGLGDFAHRFLASGVFFPDGYWVVYHGLFLVDVLVFAVGYGLEHPRLGNEIRSVEPTFLGWFVTLACYPPLFLATARVIGWHTDDYPAYDAAWLRWLAAPVILGCVGVYVWATLALGFKASNLTHRGVVRTGPYAWVRHPAYVGKNLAWWVGAVPLLIHQAGQGLAPAAVVLLGMTAWSLIYCLRALTEERHLGRDPEYQEYCQRVRYRFIPGLI
jgi:protein-S-isoprenylcysteine O-methyltransferase Ste14